MPLSKSMSHGEKVGELIRAFKKTGKIGTSRPDSKKAAVAQANAIAYAKERERRK